MAGCASKDGHEVWSTGGCAEEFDGEDEGLKVARQ